MRMFLSVASFFVYFCYMEFDFETFGLEVKKEEIKCIVHVVQDHLKV